MMRIFIFILSISFLNVSAAWAEDTPLLKDSIDKYSYSLGHQVGEDFKQQDTALDREAFAKGLADGALADSVPALPQDEMAGILLAFKDKIVAEHENARQMELEKYQAEDREFLAENAKKDDIVSMPSGLQYRIVTQGAGKQPTIEDTVKVHYRGATLDGKEFTNSESEYAPTSFKIDALVKGLQEALLLMKEGDKWQIFIPADLAYGSNGPLAGRAVVYELELGEIK